MFRHVRVSAVAIDPIAQHSVVAEVHEVVWHLPLEAYADGVRSFELKPRPLIVTTFVVVRG